VTATGVTSAGEAAGRSRAGSIPDPRGPGPIGIARIAGRGLASRRLRSSLTAVGIAIGIAAMVAVLAISDSSRASLLAVLDRLGTNMLTVSPGQSFMGDDTALPDEALGMIRRIRPVQAASAATTLQASVRRTDLISRSETGGLSVQAVDHSLLVTLGGTVQTGRFLDAALERYPTVVLGSVAAARLGIVDLDAPVQVWIAGRWFTVVGILDSLPLAPELDRAALIGRDAAETWLDADIAPSTVYIRVNPARVDEVRAVLGATANPENPEAVNVQRPSDAIEARAAAATTFTTLFLGLAAVALGVAALGIANVMLMTVMERRPEIGLRRAQGCHAGCDRRAVLRRGAAARGDRRGAGRHRWDGDRRRLRHQPGLAGRGLAARRGDRIRGDAAGRVHRGAVPGDPGRERAPDGCAAGGLNSAVSCSSAWGFR
jgi:putative ABC transport system permease protein